MVKTPWAKDAKQQLLAPEVLQRVDKELELFEEAASKKGAQVHYIELLEALERKYSN